MLRIGFDLAAQPLHVHVDEPCVAGMAIAPDLLQQQFAGERLPRGARECEQQVELQRGERNQSVTAVHRVRVDVDDQVTDAQHRGVLAGGAHPAQPRPDPRQEFLCLERLGHVVVGARLQPLDHVTGVGLRGEHHDRHIRFRPQVATHVDAVATGKHQIQQNEVGLVRAKRLERLVAAGDSYRLEAGRLQHDLEHLRQRDVVVDDEHLAPVTSVTCDPPQFSSGVGVHVASQPSCPP